MKQNFKLGGSLVAALRPRNRPWRLGFGTDPDHGHCAPVPIPSTRIGRRSAVRRRPCATSSTRSSCPTRTCRLKPGLATSWKPVDDTTWEFKIREGVKFHDGSELTAEDVKFSIDRIPVVTGPMSMTIYTKQVAETKVADKYTLHVKTKARGADPAERLHPSLRGVEDRRHGSAQRAVQLRQGRHRHRPLQVRLLGAEGRSRS